MKKILVKVMTVLMFITFILVGCNKKAEAQTSKTSNGKVIAKSEKVAPESDFEVEFVNNETAVKITEYKGNSKTLIIPSTIQGYPVVYIDMKFSDYDEPKNLETLIIPEGVVSFRYDTGNGCPNLETVELPESLKFLGEGAFFYSGLKSISFPKGLEYIGNSAFSGCKNLTNIDFSTAPNLKLIGGYAFHGTGVKEVVLPDSLKYIGVNAFADCDNLSFESIKLPSEPSKVTILSYSSELWFTLEGGTGVFTSTKFSEGFTSSDLKVRKAAIDKWETLKNMEIKYYDKESDLNEQIIGDFPDLKNDDLQGALGIFIRY